MDRLELHFNRRFKIMMVLLGLVSFGFLPLLLWFAAARHYPRALDAEGVTLRSGERLPWRDLTGRHTTVARLGGGRSAVTVVDLRFGRRTAKISVPMLAEGAQAVAYLDRLLGATPAA